MISDFEFKTQKKFISAKRNNFFESKKMTEKS